MWAFSGAHSAGQVARCEHFQGPTQLIRGPYVGLLYQGVLSQLVEYVDDLSLLHIGAHLGLPSYLARDPTSRMGNIWAL